MVPTAVGDIQQQEDSNRSGDDTEDEEGLGSSSEGQSVLLQEAFFPSPPKPFTPQLSCSIF